MSVQSDFITLPALSLNSHPPCSIHHLGSKVVATDHPDARAVMYENDTYNKRKINDLLQVS